MRTLIDKLMDSTLDEETKFNLIALVVEARVAGMDLNSPLDMAAWAAEVRTQARRMNDKVNYVEILKKWRFGNTQEPIHADIHDFLRIVKSDEWDTWKCNVTEDGMQIQFTAPRNAYSLRHEVQRKLMPMRIKGKIEYRLNEFPHGDYFFVRKLDDERSLIFSMELVKVRETFITIEIVNGQNEYFFTEN